MSTGEFLLTVPLKKTQDLPLAPALKVAFVEAGFSPTNKILTRGLAALEELRKEIAVVPFPRSHAALTALGT